MANLAFLFDAPMMTADNSVKTHGGHPDAEKPPSHVYRYMMATAPPDDRVIMYRQLVGSKWLWSATVHPKATVANPYSRRALRTRAMLKREVPGELEIVQAPANKRSAAA